MWFINLMRFIQLWSGRIDGLAIWPCAIAVVASIFIARARGWTGLGLLYASFGFGIFLWTTCFLYTFDNFGLFWLIVGLFFFGVGIVPLAFVACLLNHDWAGAAIIIGAGFLIFGSRALSLYLIENSPQTATAP